MAAVSPKPWYKNLFSPLQNAWDRVKDREPIPGYLTWSEHFDRAANIFLLNGPSNFVRQFRLDRRMDKEDALTSLWDRRKHEAFHAAMASKGTMAERLEQALEIGTREWWLKQTTDDSDHSPEAGEPSKPTKAFEEAKKSKLLESGQPSPAQGHYAARKAAYLAQVRQERQTVEHEQAYKREL